MNYYLTHTSPEEILLPRVDALSSNAACKRVSLRAVQYGIKSICILRAIISKSRTRLDDFDKYLLSSTATLDFCLSVGNITYYHNILPVSSTFHTVFETERTEIIFRHSKYNLCHLCTGLYSRPFRVEKVPFNRRCGFSFTSHCGSRIINSA